MITPYVLERVEGLVYTSSAVIFKILQIAFNV
jgi:hypothetical protein